jgi:DNA-3-methyladenine glycosylase
MRHRRRLDDVRLLAAGPGRLCEALGVTGEHDGLALDRPPFALLPREAEPEIVATPRIGITRAADYPWRYVLKGSRYLSRSVPRA